jgi:hypothetical protein
MITIALSQVLILGETQLLLPAGKYIQSTGWPFLETSLRSFFLVRDDETHCLMGNPD